MIETQRLAADPAGIARAAGLLRDGGLVAFATETVYGLGADATDGHAVAGIFAAKGRPRFNPLIVHLATTVEVEAHAILDARAHRLAEAFWPGPLTLVLPRRPDSPVHPLVSAGLPTLALRVPAAPSARALIAAADRPLAAPSANPSGRISPTTASHVIEALGGHIAAVLDGGPCPVGVESTIVGLTEGRPVLLRPGGLASEEIEALLGLPLARPPGGDAISASGQLASHYAPGARLRLRATAPRFGEGWLGFGPDGSGIAGPARSLSAGGDLAEAAANLFGHLHALDAELGGTGTIAVAPIPNHGLGVAINDRLARAAAPRG